MVDLFQQKYMSGPHVWECARASRDSPAAI